MHTASVAYRTSEEEVEGIEPPSCIIMRLTVKFVSAEMTRAPTTAPRSGTPRATSAKSASASTRNPVTNEDARKSSSGA